MEIFDIYLDKDFHNQRTAIWLEYFRATKAIRCWHILIWLCLAYTSKKTRDQSLKTQLWLYIISIISFKLSVFQWKQILEMKANSISPSYTFHFIVRNRFINKYSLSWWVVLANLNFKLIFTHIFFQQSIIMPTAALYWLIMIDWYGLISAIWRNWYSTACSTL